MCSFPPHAAISDDGVMDALTDCFSPPLPQTHTPPLPPLTCPHVACADTLLFPESRAVEVSLLVHEPDTHCMSNPSKSTGEAAKARLSGRLRHHDTTRFGCRNILHIQGDLTCYNALQGAWITQNLIGQESTAKLDCCNKERFFHHNMLDLIGKCTWNSKVLMIKWYAGRAFFFGLLGVEGSSWKPKLMLLQKELGYTPTWSGHVRKAQRKVKKKKKALNKSERQRVGERQM